jgi:poly(3-hydroxybutyrate) depolymerase
VSTWLTQDIRTLIDTDVHRRASGYRWDVLGLSAGGACPVRLALTKPQSFAAAANLSGFTAPDSPAPTRSEAAGKTNDLRTFAAAGVSRPVGLLLAGSQQHPGTTGDANRLKAAAGPGVAVALELLSRGGHNRTPGSR